MSVVGFYLSSRDQTSSSTPFYFLIDPKSRQEKETCTRRMTRKSIPISSMNGTHSHSHERRQEIGFILGKNQLNPQENVLHESWKYLLALQMFAEFFKSVLMLSKTCNDPNGGFNRPKVVQTIRRRCRSN